MPPKLKLHHKRGKSFPTKFPPTVPEARPQNEPQQSESVDDSAQAGGSRDEQVQSMDAQFELELCWCVQELEISLQSKKMNPKQAQESMSILKVLRSKTQPTVRKRQLMRTHFGDYRTKMAKEEKQSKKINDQISFSTPGPSDGKSTYIRKSFAQSMGDNTFKFNFDLPTSDGSASGDLPSAPANTTNDDNIKRQENNIENHRTINPNKFQFSSGGVFKFNFDINEASSFKIV